MSMPTPIRVWNIARNTGARLLFYGTEASLDYLKDIQVRHPIDASFHVFSDWEDFLILSRELKANDNLFIVMSRKHYASYNIHMAKIPVYLNKYFQDSNFTLIYPMQQGISGENNRPFRDPSVLEPLQENLDRLDEAGRTISRLFRRK